MSLRGAFRSDTFDSAFDLGNTNLNRVGEWTLAKSAGSYLSPITVYDIGGDGHHGISANTLVFTAGTRGSANAVSFNGANDKITIGNTEQTIKSVSFWINLDDNTTRDIIDFDGGTHVISVDGAGDIVATGFSSPTIYIDNSSSDPAVTADNWTSVIVTTETGFTASSLVLGFETTWLDGDLANVRMYDTVLTETERYILYNADRPIQFPTTSGLVGYWTLRNQSLTDTTTFLDRGTGHNNGISANTPTLTTGPIGIANNAMTFNGSSDNVSITPTIVLKPTQDISIAAWVKLDDLISSGRVLGLTEESGGAGLAYSIRKTGDNLDFTLRTAGGEIFSRNGVTPQDVWVHFVGVYDGSKTYAYFNGDLVDSDNQTGNIDYTWSTIFSIGRKNQADGEYFAGSIANVRVYNRTLSLTEIGIIYNYELTGIPQ